MRKLIGIASLTLSTCLVFTAPLLAQCGLPADSPVLSNSVDDIPVTNSLMYTYPAGTTAPGRANHRVAFVQINSNEQRVYFAIDGTAASGGGIFYNRRYRADANSPWYWQFSTSPALTFGGSTPMGFPGAVLYSSVPKYGLGDGSMNPMKYVMFGAFQPAACDGPVGGFLVVSFSNDGLCWTSPHIVINNSWEQTYDCDPDAGNAVTAELVTAFDIPDGCQIGCSVGVITMSGDNVRLATPWRMDWPEAYLWRIGANYMASANLWDPIVQQLSNGGIVNPRGTGSSCYPGRTTPYAYFFNLDAAYDAAAGNVYFSRAYPYPFDRDWQGGTCAPIGSQVPSTSQTAETIYNGASVQGCIPAPATLPNRVQIYKMHIGAMTSLNTILSGTWTLVADFGGSVGYENMLYGGNQPLNAGQTNIGADWGALTFLRDGAGNMLFSGNQYTVLGGDTYKKSKSIGPCRVTGLERVTQMTLTK